MIICCYNKKENLKSKDKQTMDTSDLKEKNFEADIERYLITEGGYVKGNQDTYDKERAIDMPVLISFIEKTQPKQWKRYVTKYGDKAERQLYRVFQDDVTRYGLIYVLRKGISDVGINIRFCYFAPASSLNDELVANYHANILTVTRQFAYSKLNRNTIDMVLSLNGIPVVALELKNQITGQNVEDSKRQWRTDRDPKEPLFRFNNRILAYFGGDLYEVALTTELKKEKTFFIPFNQGSNGAGKVGGAGNPEREDGGYVTSYLWEHILQRDMLLAILQRYISRQEEEKLKIIIDKHGREKEVTETSVKIIFPRYHQLDVVEKLVADTYYANLVKKRGDDKEVNYGMAADEIPLYASRKKPHGNNFLIQHSAGSGKSNSIAWLTYRLAGLQDADMKNMFNSVFVITDRRVLNKQLQSTILGFDHIDGQIETITDADSSEKLARIINDDNTRIVITTLHRFPVIYKELTSRSGKRYAIVVDEAHSSQSGKSAEKLKAALADTDEALREYAEIEEVEAEELEKKKDALLEDLLAQGQHSNLFFYAFTATPKPKTLQTFGELAEEGDSPEDNRYVAYHNYSMLQAIEEGFILDVLKYYTTYDTTYEIAKRIEADPSYEETPATRAIKAFHDNHQHVIAQKTAIIVEKFRAITLHAMQGQAKAMVVTSSRAHALRYFLQIKKYCEEKGYTDVHPMVAFSGKVKYGDTEFYFGGIVTPATGEHVWKASETENLEVCANCGATKQKTPTESGAYYELVLLSPTNVANLDTDASWDSNTPSGVTDVSDNFAIRYEWDNTRDTGWWDAWVMVAIGEDLYEAPVLEPDANNIVITRGTLGGNTTTTATLNGEAVTSVPAGGTADAFGGHYVATIYRLSDTLVLEVKLTRPNGDVLIVTRTTKGFPTADASVYLFGNLYWVDNITMSTGTMSLKTDLGLDLGEKDNSTGYTDTTPLWADGTISKGQTVVLTGTATSGAAGVWSAPLPYIWTGDAPSLNFRPDNWINYSTNNDQATCADFNFAIAKVWKGFTPEAVNGADWVASLVNQYKSGEFECTFIYDWSDADMISIQISFVWENATFNQEYQITALDEATPLLDTYSIGLGVDGSFFHVDYMEIR